MTGRSWKLSAADDMILAETIRRDGFPVDVEALPVRRYGNRVTYQDERNSVTTLYTANEANEYLTVGGYTVAHDAAGNLTSQIIDASDNAAGNLTRRFIDGGDDADGDLSRHGFDGSERPAGAVTCQPRATPWVADALTGRSPAGATQRRARATPADVVPPLQGSRSPNAHNPGRRFALPWADMFRPLRGVGTWADMFRPLRGARIRTDMLSPLRGVRIWTDMFPSDRGDYLLKELYTVAGLIKRNGTLVEANTYDAYGNVHPWGYRDFDFNRDGDVDSTDVSVMSGLSTDPNIPTSDPTADFDMDGDVDILDAAALTTTPTNEPPVTLTASAVGNPYFFTGRRLLFYEDKPCDGICGDPEYLNRQIQYSRARWYNPDLGRWMQRDPIEYSGGGMSLYEYALSRPTTLTDALGTKPLECPKGEISVSRGIPVPVNGCGSGWTQHIVPDRWPPGSGAANFTPACNTHDKCYGDCQKSKAECDREFREDLQVACIYAYPFNLKDQVWEGGGEPTFTFTGRIKEKALKVCMEFVARVYEAAVSNLGEKAHTESQKAHCICCPPPRKP